MVFAGFLCPFFLSFVVLGVLGFGPGLCKLVFVVFAVYQIPSTLTEVFFRLLGFRPSPLLFVFFLCFRGLCPGAGFLGFWRFGIFWFAGYGKTLLFLISFFLFLYFFCFSVFLAFVGLGVFCVFGLLACGAVCRYSKTIAFCIWSKPCRPPFGPRLRQPTGTKTSRSRIVTRHASDRDILVPVVFGICCF